jgi:putative hydrolase of the HAD superfamily
MKSEKRFKAVIFDLYTTLTSLRHLKDAPGRFSHEILGISRELWVDALFNDSRERLTGVLQDPVEIVRDIAWKIDPSVPEEALVECCRERRIRFRYCLEQPPAGVVDSLRLIRSAGYRMGLCSNADVTEIEAWPGTDLASCFDTAVFSCYEGCMKPDPEIFALIAGRLGVKPEECLYVGDGGNSELIASAQAGMTAVLTTQFLRASAPHLVEERAKTVDHIIENLNEILPLLERLQS